MRFFPAALATLALVSTVAAEELVLVPGSAVTAPGGRIRGKVEKETPELVRVAGRDVPLDQVDEIIYDAPGLSYSQGKVQESVGELAKATDLYQKAIGEATNPLVAQDARFRHASVLTQRAKADPAVRDEAIKALQSIVSELPTSRHYGPALELLAELKLEAGNFDEADKALQDLSRLSWAADRSAVLQAQVMVKRGQSEQALGQLENLARRLPEGAPARRQAELAKAEALADLSRFDEAEQVVRAVIESASPEDSATLAPAYNTLGDCLRAAGKPRDALFAYLNTDILYPC